jgi:hypothetical protein
MTSCGYTSIVYNNPNKLVGLPPYIYRKRGCNTHLTGNTPADQYQKQKYIQNTLRIYASLYTANLGPLTAYSKPLERNYGVCWNQMSDRPVASVQKALIPTGFNNSLNKRHTSVTSSKPGCQTPGGIGCDIKHNSYDRYLNRLKGRGPMRRGVIPPDFGRPIKFNPAFPIYGGKTFKANIVAGCDCPIDSKTGLSLNQEKNYQDKLIFNNPKLYPYPSGNCNFQVNNYVYAIKIGNRFYSRALITSINNGIYTIEFDDGSIQNANFNELLIYFPCNCDVPTAQSLVSSGIYYNKTYKNSSTVCYIPDNLLNNVSL